MAERVKEQEFEEGFLHGWDGSECIYYTDESAYIIMTQKHRATIATTTQGRHSRKLSGNQKQGD